MEILKALDAPKEQIIGICTFLKTEDMICACIGKVGRNNGKRENCRPSRLSAKRRRSLRRSDYVFPKTRFSVTNCHALFGVGGTQ